ncbi:hypothetical protein Pcinc_041783 [Petrolisthes cinctipes]|uniref:Uncharacterized protein n=1 Tax=Petrolisthes cinctipes TaxID=88211 RepID=A0AAE1BJ71_PETCI|nr:hypothetical protein Pcinc_041783 [Petrolisthes cinctipes]
MAADRALKGIVVTYLVFILFQQLLSLFQNKLQWFKSLSGVLHVVITVLVMAVVLPPLPQEWQHHLASWLMRTWSSQTPSLTFVKTLTMMIGELDFGEDFVNGLSLPRVYRPCHLPLLRHPRVHHPVQPTGGSGR